MTRIQYASDLHLEFADNWRYLKQHPLKVCGDILILAGDIGYLGDENYSKHPFWDWASENYKQVYCCMGNHEFYKYFDVAILRNGHCMRIRPNCQNCLAKASVIFSTMITMSMSCVAWPLQRYQPCSTHRPFRL